MRMNQLPMPASGASTARFWRRTPPSSQGWSITRDRLERDDPVAAGSLFPDTHGGDADGFTGGSGAKRPLTGGEAVGVAAVRVGAADVLSEGVERSDL